VPPVAEVELAAAVPTPRPAAVSTSGAAQWGLQHLRRARPPRFTDLVAVACVVAAVSAAWTVLAALAWTAEQLQLFAPSSVAAAAPLWLAIAAAPVAGVVQLARRVAFYRMERWRERIRWSEAAPGFHAALLAKRAEPTRTPKPALQLRGR